jgi:addiction module RelE/StbE family toxin
MASKYQLFPKAKEDLEAIFSYISIEQREPEAALKLIYKFETKFEELCDFPKAYPLIFNLNIQHKNLRKCLIENYLIVYLYKEKKDVVEIVRVLHTKKDFYNAL